MQTDTTKSESLLIEVMVLDLPMNQQESLMEILGYRSRTGFIKLLRHAERMPLTKAQNIQDFLERYHEKPMRMDFLLAPLSTSATV